MVNIHEAKTQLSKLVARAASGEEIVIAKAGVPMARLVPYAPEAQQERRPGSMAGRIWMADNWDSDETNAEIARGFYEEESEDEAARTSGGPR